MEEIEKKAFSLKTLFTNFFSISMFTLGGGYSMLLPLYEFYVKEKKLISQEDWDEAIIISQSSPGAFAVNLAYLVGYYTHGIWGAIIAIIGMVLPSFLSMLTLGSLMIYFFDGSTMKTFLFGVACGPVAYYVDAFYRSAVKAFKEIKVILAFMLFIVLIYYFKLPILSVISIALATVLVQVILLFFKTKFK